MHIIIISANGEIWVFNRSYTQYIPLSLYDLQTWMGSPSIFVYDCSNAGIIVNSFDQFAEQHERDYQAQVGIIAVKFGLRVWRYRLDRSQIKHVIIYLVYFRFLKMLAKENHPICQQTLQLLQ